MLKGIWAWLMRSGDSPESLRNEWRKMTADSYEERIAMRLSFHEERGKIWAECKQEAERLRR